MSRPLIGRKYTHFKGGTYMVLVMATDTTTMEDVVVYVNTQSGELWTRPVHEWMDIVKVSKSGMELPRFQLMSQENENIPCTANAVAERCHIEPTINYEPPSRLLQPKNAESRSTSEKLNIHTA